MTILVHPTMVERVLDVVRDTPGETRARLLHVFCHVGALTREVAAEHVGGAWCACLWPLEALGRDEWRALFELAGYTDNGVAAVRPIGHMRLFRGAPLEGRHGWSWTEDVALAELFADRRRGGRVWVADVEPWRLFARCSTEAEREYVVDADGLAVQGWAR